MTFTHMLRIAAKLCLCLLLPTAYAQNGGMPPSLFQPQPRLSASPPILLVTSQSDPDAVSALERVIHASGGSERWSTIHSATLRVRFGSALQGKTLERLFMDDWSGDMPQYRRSIIGTQQPPKDHDGRDHYVVHTQLGDRGIPEFDQAHLLAGNLPAAAAFVILSSPRYIARLVSGPTCTDQETCIDIYSKSTHGFRRQEEWVLSKATGLPETIDLVLPSLFNNHSAVEQFQFLSYTSQDNILLPNRWSVTAPGGQPNAITLVRADLNKGFDKASFDAEVHAK